MIKNRVILLVAAAMAMGSCKKDDDGGVQIVPPRLLSEVVVEDQAKITAYLQTHFYNYEEFEAPAADFDYKIKIDTIAGENANKTPLIQQMASKTVKVSSSHLGLSVQEDDIEHTIYYLIGREGVGDKLSVADSIYVRYEGNLLDGKVFDGANVPIWFDLISAVRGFGEGAAFFRGGGTPTLNEDGTFTVEDYGVGLIIFPSGLGYYNVTRTTIPAYSPLVFKIEVIAAKQTDHDGDGIPSIQEDLNGDGYLYNDNTDEAQEIANRSQLYANFLDSDDDGDGIPTREEILIDGEIKKDANGLVIFPDRNGNGIPDHLDPSI